MVSVWKTTAAVLAIVIIIGAGALYFFTLPKTPGTLTKIKLQLNWNVDSYHAGVTIAIDKGYFADEGLDVEIVTAPGSAKALNFIASGAADIGIAGASTLLQARAVGVPVVATMMIFQQNPVYFVTLPGRGITTPNDFVGKRVGVELTSVTYVVYQAMMAKLGIDRTKITEIPISFDEITPLAGNLTDVSPGYGPTLVDYQAKGLVNLTVFNATDYGINMYDLAVIATQNTITNRPNMVRGVVNALVKGYQYAIAHPGEAAESVVRHAPDLNMATILAKWQIASSQFIQSNATAAHGLGWMDASVWQSTASMLQQYNQLNGTVDVNAAFTNSFLPTPGG